MANRLSLQDVTLDVEKFRAAAIIPRGMTLELSDSNFGAFMANEVVATLTRELATIPYPETLRIPDGWWQAWKEANLDVLLRFFPVRYREYRALACFPEFDVAAARRRDPLGPVSGHWLEIRP